MATEDFAVLLRNSTITQYTVCGERLGKKSGADSLRFEGVTAVAFPVRCVLTGDTVFALKVMFNFYEETYSRIAVGLRSECAALDDIPRNPFTIPKYAQFTGSASKLGIKESDESFDRTLFIVMELGRISLNSFLADRQRDNKPLSREEVFEIIFSVLQGVAVMHKHKIAHCDIKPDNIMQMNDGRWVLIDFGECKNWNSEDMATYPLFSLTYYPGMPRGGAPTRMAPEIYHAVVQSTLNYSKYDVFSVGCLLYNLCGMESPFDADGFRKGKHYAVSDLPPLPDQYGCFTPLLCALLQCDPMSRIGIDQIPAMMNQLKTEVLVESACDILLGRNEQRQDWRRGVQLLRPFADVGHSKACMIVGYSLSDGIGVNVDRTEAAVLLQRSSHPNAQFMRFAWGIGTTQNLKAACQAVAEAADADDVFVLNCFGNCFRSGYGVTKDKQKAFQYYHRSAAGGHVEAMFNLGICYRNGFGVVRDTTTAFHLYRRAAEQGYCSALLNLAWCYSTGSGVEVDEQRAFQCYLEAAQQGHAPAMYNTAACYEQGDGTAKNVDEAQRWYRKAFPLLLADAERGDGTGLMFVGRYYEFGNGDVVKDLHRALHYYTRAAKLHSDAAAAIQRVKGKLG